MEIRSVGSTHEASIRNLLAAEGWTVAQIEGQLSACKSLARSDDGFVGLVVEGDVLLGFVSAQFYRWNRLTQIHGLAVASENRRQGIASRLVGEAETLARSKGARGLYVDTPVDNEAGRAFYLSIGFTEAYRMPRYYSDELDGVTFTMFFD